MHHHYIHRLRDPETIYALARDLFVAGSIACALCAFHRIAAAVKLGARVKALDNLEEMYTPEERDDLIHKIKVKSLHC